METKSIYDDIFEKECSVCGKVIHKDVYEQGDCPYCKWKNNNFADINPNNVIYPNLISLNRAKQLFREGKSLEPNLDEFIHALHGYSEMQFEYKGVYYAVELIYDENKTLKIRFYNSQTKKSIFFDDDTDFKNNAKIGDEYIKDVWEQTSDRYWLQ